MHYYCYNDSTLSVYHYLVVNNNEITWWWSSEYQWYRGEEMWEHYSNRVGLHWIREVSKLQVLVVCGSLPCEDVE